MTLILANLSSGEASSLRSSSGPQPDQTARSKPRNPHSLVSNSLPAAEEPAGSFRCHHCTYSLGELAAHSTQGRSAPAYYYDNNAGFLFDGFADGRVRSVVIHPGRLAAPIVGSSVTDPLLTAAQERARFEERA